MEEIGMQMAMFRSTFFGSAFSASILACVLPTAARAGAPQDWSQSHLIYSNVQTAETAARDGTLEQWKRNAQDPRFLSQLAKQSRSRQAMSVAVGNGGGKPGSGGLPTVHRDWSNVMGGASGVGASGVFPAKWGADFTTADCNNDYVTYTTASSGVTGSGALASQTGTFSKGGDVGKTIKVTNGANVLTLTSSATVNSGMFFVVGQGGTDAANAIVSAGNLAAAINRNGGTVGVTASSSGAVVTVTAITAGAPANNIALTEGVANYLWTGAKLSGGTGTAGQPTIIAFNQLYSACGGSSSQPVPSAYWSYNTGVGAIADTSPVVSLNGDQVVFTQRSGGGAASLVVLKWSSTQSVGTVGAPTVLTSVAAGSYRACTAPCMTVIPFSGGSNNTNSSPFYVYGSDVLFVGDDNGRLHKFSGIFSGTPAEAGSPWPVNVTSGNALSSPVYDFGTGLVFAVSSPGDGNGARLYSVDSNNATVNASGTLSDNTSILSDSPIVDSQAQKVYAFVAIDTSSSCGGKACSAVYQFSTASAISGLTTPRAQVGRGDSNNASLYHGAFDDAYYSSVDSTGSMYVCGSQTGAATTPTLWKIPITNNAMGSPVVGPKLAGGGRTCSPVMEVKNGANDFIFMSVDGGATASTGCAGACVFAYNLTGLTWGTGITPDSSLNASGGTGGLIIDGMAATTGASQIYYATRTSPGNAVQASQSGLN
jgi:hypothetical protein